MTVQYGNTLCSCKIYAISSFSCYLCNESVIAFTKLVWNSPPLGRCTIFKRIYIIRKKRVLVITSNQHFHKPWWRYKILGKLNVGGNKATNICTILNENIMQILGTSTELIQGNTRRKIYNITQSIAHMHMG